MRKLSTHGAAAIDEIQQGAQNEEPPKMFLIHYMKKKENEHLKRTSFNVHVHKGNSKLSCAKTILICSNAQNAANKS